jgi:hypothetical protein
LFRQAERKKSYKRQEVILCKPVSSPCFSKGLIRRKGMEVSAIEKIAFITNELKEISKVLEKSEGDIVHVEMDVSDPPRIRAQITLSWFKTPNEN